jgi:hypothetical protein
MGIPIANPQSGIEVLHTSILKDIWLWVILHLRRSTPAKPCGDAFVNGTGIKWQFVCSSLFYQVPKRKMTGLRRYFFIPLSHHHRFPPWR